MKLKRKQRVIVDFLAVVLVICFFEWATIESGAYGLHPLALGFLLLRLDVTITLSLMVVPFFVRLVARRPLRSNLFILLWYIAGGYLVRGICLLWTGIPLELGWFSTVLTFYLHMQILTMPGVQE